MEQKLFDDPDAKIVVSGSNGGPLRSFFPTYDLSIDRLRWFIRVAFEMSGTEADALDGTYFSVKITRSIPMSSVNEKLWTDAIELDLNDPTISATNDKKHTLPNPTMREIAVASTTEDDNNNGPHIYFIVVYPSPSRLILQTRRPIINESSSKNRSIFTVEIYNPHLHSKLYHRYNMKVHEENESLTHPKNLFSPLLDITELGPNIVFIALRDGVEMIGYAMFSIGLLPLQNSENMKQLFDDSKGHHANHFFSNVPPHNLFIIDSLSVLNAYNGYDVSSILVYHGLSFLEQHNISKYNISHVVSLSVSAATKHILVDRMGFNYFGRNVFINDDFVDTLDAKTLSTIRHFLRSIVNLFLSTIPSIENHITPEFFHILITTYQMCVLLNMRYHEILSLLLTLQKYTNATKLNINLDAKYFVDNINLFLRTFNRDYILENWRRERLVYISPVIQQPNGGVVQIGLPITSILPKKNKTDLERAIFFGYDQLLVIYHYINTNYPTTLFTGIFNLFNEYIVEDIKRLINGNPTTTTTTGDHYMMNFYQLENINKLFDPSILDIYGIRNAKLAETNMIENRSDIEKITSPSFYDIIVGIDTVTPLVKIPFIVEFGNLYANGLTKNFNPRATVNPVGDTSDSSIIKFDNMEMATDYILQDVMRLVSEKMLLESFSEPSTKVYSDFTLLELTEYYNGLNVIYRYKTNNWKNY
jgi:hypothetical protein